MTLLPTDDNSMIPQARSALPGVSALSYRRRRTSHAVGGRRARVQRRLRAFYLSVECLEPRTLLAGLSDPPELSFVEDSWETPAVVLESKCSVIGIENTFPVQGDDSQAEIAIEDVPLVVGERSETEGNHDAVDESSCSSDGDTYGSRFIADFLEDSSFGLTESTLDQNDSSIHSDLTTLTSDAATGGESSRKTGAALDTEANADPIFPQPAEVDTSAGTPRHPDRTMANADSLLRTSAAPFQQPLYFSGTTTLSRASWNASDEVLVDANLLLDVISLEVEKRTAPTEKIAVAPREPVLLSESVTDSARAGETLSGDDFVRREVAFSQVESWTRSDKLSSSPTAVVEVVFSHQPADNLVPVSLRLAPDAGDLLAAMAPASGESPGANELATAHVALPLTQVQSWHLLGGVGLWQVILSARARQRKQRGQNNFA